MKRPFIHESRVRFGDTDASGRIFYLALLRHFDAAETEFMRSIGAGYREIQDEHTSFPRVHVECDYTSALRFDDLMRIEVSVEGRSAARGKVTIVAMSRQTQRPVPLPGRVRSALEASLKAGEPPGGF